LNLQSNPESKKVAYKICSESLNLCFFGFLVLAFWVFIWHNWELYIKLWYQRATV